jgi:hypothetical protein
MSRVALIACAAALAALVPDRSAAQEWRPPSREMPMMPAAAELAGNWIGPRADWFIGVGDISGVQPSELNAVGQGRAGSGSALVVHFNSGPLPVVVWQDRNSDGRSDIIEIYRSGGVVIQVIDADYDGQANVMRVYEAGGTLRREERL